MISPRVARALDRLDERRQEVLPGVQGRPQSAERGLDLALRPLRPQLPQALGLLLLQPLGGGVDLELRAASSADGELVQADDDPLLVLDLAF